MKSQKHNRVWKRCLRLVRQLDQTKNRIRRIILQRQIWITSAKMASLDDPQQVQI